MLNRLYNFKIHEWIITVILILLLMNIVIILDVPFLREIITFIFITFIPGILILQILRSNEMEFLKKIVLSVGLSISFLIFTGLLLNSFYPFILKPLSLMPVLVLFDVILVILALIVYQVNKNDFSSAQFLNFKLNLEDKLTSMLIFPVIFPFLAILGTYLMNTTQNNILLLIMLFLIPAYIIAVVILRNRISNITYPFALWTISLGLLLMNGLTSYHLMGRDIHTEYYCFQLTLQNFHWDLNVFQNPYNTCISITILPSIYQILSNLNSEYVIKIFFSIIGSFIPLTVYMVSKKYLEQKYAFFAALLFTFQIFFVYLLGAVRQEIAILFFFLAVMILFASDINKTTKKILFLVFMFSVIVSHYTTAYVSFVLILPVLLVPFLKGLFFEKKIKFTNFDIIILSFLFILAWYILFAKVQATAGTHVVETTVASVGIAGANATRGEMVLGVLGLHLKSIPNAISVAVHDLIFFTIGIGVLTIIWNYKQFIQKIDPEYIVGILISICLLILFIVMPYISIAYDASRLFFQLLIFLAPIFVIGAVQIAKIIKKPKWNILILVVLLISLFSCATYLQYHFYGTPYSSNYEKDGLIRNEQYIYNQELTGVKWLNINGINNSTVYFDGREVSRFQTVYNTNNIKIDDSFFKLNKTVQNGYIYLGYMNVYKNKVYEIYDDIYVNDMKNYSNLFLGKEKIYDSGGSQIWL